jgi:hypothetical protein
MGLLALRAIVQRNPKDRVNKEQDRPRFFTNLLNHHAASCLGAAASVPVSINVPPFPAAKAKEKQQ